MRQAARRFARRGGRFGVVRDVVVGLVALVFGLLWVTAAARGIVDEARIDADPATADGVVVAVAAYGKADIPVQVVVGFTDTAGRPARAVVDGSQQPQERVRVTFDRADPSRARVGGSALAYAFDVLELLLGLALLTAPVVVGMRGVRARRRPAAAR